MMQISCSVSHTAPTAEFERIFISFLLKPLPWEFGRSACPSHSSKFVRTSGFTEIVVSTSPVLRFRLESTFCDISGGLLLKRCMLAEIITVSNHKEVSYLVAPLSSLCLIGYRCAIRLPRRQLEETARPSERDRQIHTMRGSLS